MNQFETPRSSFKPQFFQAPSSSIHPTNPSRSFRSAGSIHVASSARMPRVGQGENLHKANTCERFRRTLSVAFNWTWKRGSTRKGALETRARSGIYFRNISNNSTATATNGNAQQQQQQTSSIHDDRDFVDRDASFNFQSHQHQTSLIARESRGRESFQSRMPAYEGGTRRKHTKRGSGSII